MPEQKFNHRSGIAARYRLLKAICFGKTGSLVNECEAYLNETGHVYPGVCADLEPFSFFEKVFGECPNRVFELDFSDLDAYSFSETSGGQLPEWTAEPEVSLFIGRLVFGMDATVAVEIGCFTGATSAYIARAFSFMTPKNRKLYCVDISDEIIRTAEQHLSRLGLINNAQLITGSSLDQKTLDIIPDADVVFIDSAHDFETTCAEIDVFSKKLKERGILVLHDSVQWPGVRNALWQYSRQFQVFSFATSRGNGLSILRKK
jgi:predicted O-methyltransferase YrrM